MKNAGKAIAALLIQLTLFFIVPKGVQSLRMMNQDWVRNWKYVGLHRFFSEPAARKKVVLLGTSMFGERYCYVRPNESHPTERNSCILSNIMELYKDEYPGMEDMHFYSFARGGSEAQAHLYFLLSLLEADDGSLKTVIYDVPSRFDLNTNDEGYTELHAKLLEKISTVQKDPRMRSEKLEKFARLLRKHALVESRASELSFEDIFETLRYHRAWYADFMAALKERLPGQTLAAQFKRELANHELLYASHAESFEKPLNHDDAIDERFETAEDFAFMDILGELCKKRGVQLIIYRGPSKEDYSRVYEPVRKRIEPLGARFVDYRDLEFKMPHDTWDGVHPTLSTKVKIAHRLLADLKETR